MLTVPYLARVLGPSGYGLLVFSQSLGQYFSLIAEYGFSLSATREVARFRESIERRAELAAAVTAAKITLFFPVLILAFFASRLIPSFHEYPEVLWAAMFWALAVSLNPSWYFQGLERMTLIAVTDICTKAITLLGMVIFVKDRNDTWKALSLMGLTALISTVVLMTLMYREVPVRLPAIRNVLQALQFGWNVFLFRSAVSLYTTGNTLILGFLAPPHAVGYYAGAEKISRVFTSLLNPIYQALYPRVSHLMLKSRDEAAYLAKIGVGIAGVGGALMGAVIFISAPLLVQAILGNDYHPAIQVLRILAFLPLLVGLSLILGVGWMLPIGLDRQYNIIVFCAGGLNITLAILLVPRFAHLGMAAAALCSEFLVTLSICLFLLTRSLSPFSHKVKR
jgi:PST family polysaccharide transporter